MAAVKALEKAGFRIARQGKHVVMTNGSCIITIPRHNPVNAITMGNIIRDAGLENEGVYEAAVMGNLFTKCLGLYKGSMRREMIPAKRTATHPGEILLREYIQPLGLSRKSLADHIGIPVQRVNEIVRGKRGVSPDTAWLFSEAFNTTPEFWLNLQAIHDLSCHRPDKRVEPLVMANIMCKAHLPRLRMPRVSISRYSLMNC